MQDRRGRRTASNAGLCVLLTSSPVALQCQRQIVDQRVEGSLVARFGRRMLRGRETKRHTIPEQPSSRWPEHPVRQSSTSKDRDLAASLPAILAAAAVFWQRRDAGKPETTAGDVQWSFRWAAFMPSAHRRALHSVSIVGFRPWSPLQGQEEEKEAEAGRK